MPGWTLSPEPNEASRVAALTQRQMATLRLSLCHWTSKQIAPRYGCSHYTIDKDAERAMQLLGVRGRVEAARIVLRHFIGPYERLVYEAQPLAAWGQPQALPELPALPDEPAKDAVAETLAAYTPPFAFLPEGRPKRWGNPNDLTLIKRVLLIPALAFVSLAIVFTLLAAGEKASEWVDRNLPAFRSENR